MYSTGSGAALGLAAGLGAIDCLATACQVSAAGSSAQLRSMASTPSETTATAAAAATSARRGGPRHSPNDGVPVVLLVPEDRRSVVSHVARSGGVAGAADAGSTT